MTKLTKMAYHFVDPAVTRYSMVKMTGSTTLLPAVRDDGEWVRYEDHAAALAGVVDGFDRLAGTQNSIVHQITARAEAADKRIATLEAALKPFAEMVASYEKASVAFLRETQSSAAGDMSDEAIMQVHTPDEVAAVTDGAMRNPVIVTWGDFRRARAALSAALASGDRS